MIVASAPGSVMICGEHAVVYGHPAIVCAVDARVRVTLAPATDGAIHIYSALGEYHAPAGLLHADTRLKFVIACLERYPASGALRLEIVSDIDPTLGLGSSAAVTVATLAALARHGGHDEDAQTLHAQALAIIRSLQRRGSGADLAASLTGGMIHYQNLPTVRFSALPLPPDPVSLRYAGYKTPTGEVLAQVAARMADNPDYYQTLYAQMGETSQAAADAAHARDWPAFYAFLNQYQAYMQALGVCDATQAAHIAAARAQAGVHAAKISGSGLGDCILAFAATPPDAHRRIGIDPQGVIIKQL